MTAAITSHDHATELTQAWSRVQSKLRKQFGEASYRSWLQPLRCEGREGSHVNLSVPSPFIRDWVVTHYGDAITTYWQQEFPGVAAVDIQARSAIAPRRELEPAVEAEMHPE